MKKQTRQLMAFVLALAVSFSNISVAYAGYERENTVEEAEQADSNEGLISITTPDAIYIPATHEYASEELGLIEIVPLTDATAASLFALEQAINNALPYTRTYIELTGNIDAYPIFVNIPVNRDIVLTGNYTLTGQIAVEGELTLDGITVMLPSTAGVGVSLNGGSLTMRSGAITGVTASNGVVVNGSFTMYGGEIFGNGTGVQVPPGGTFTLVDGYIRDNTITGNGGGVVVFQNALFEMRGGTISGNTATIGSGGGVWNVGDFIMTGGTITDNTALNGGGVGLVMFAGTFTMTGGYITNNTAGNEGGGIGAFWNRVSYISIADSATISGNTAANTVSITMADAAYLANLNFTPATIALFNNQQITYNRVAVRHNVTFTAGQNGNILAAANGIAVVDNPTLIEATSDIVFTAVPDSGYTVADWVINDVLQGDNSTTFTITNLNQATVVHVTFEQIIDAPVVTSMNNTSVVEGVGGTFQVTSTGTQPITYSLSGEPTGVSIDSITGLITIASTIAVGTHSFIITANNIAGDSLPQTFTLTVTAAPIAPEITSANNMSKVEGTGETFQVTSIGTQPITYSLSGEPTGVSIDSTTGIIAIAPSTAVGVHSFMIVANNVAGNSAPQTFTLTVTAAPIAPSITSGDSMSVVYGTGGTFPVTSTGTMPITFSLNGEPTGVSIDSATGIIAIAPSTAVGVHSFTITANNIAGNSAPQTFTLTVTAAPVAPSITSGDSMSVVYGTGGTFPVTSAGTMPITFSLNGEPSSVSINSTTGLITIAPSIAVGTHSFTITATNVAGNSAPQTFTLTVTAAPIAPSITSGDSMSVVYGTGGTFPVTSAGTTPITFSLNGEPTGVSINNATGLITIAPSTAVGVHSFTITANNVVGDSLPQTFTLTVTAAPIAPSITSGDSMSVVYGTGGTFPVTSAGTTPITFSLNGEPAGVGIDSATGVIAIAPSTAVGVHSFTITTTNVAGNSAPQTFTLTVTAAPIAPSITSGDNMSVVYGTGGTFPVTSAGTMPITYTLNGEPVGVSINSSTGLITVAPSTAVGTHTFTITANNVAGNSAPQTFTLTITAAEANDPPNGNIPHHPPTVGTVRIGTSGTRLPGRPTPRRVPRINNRLIPVPESSTIITNSLSQAGESNPQAIFDLGEWYIGAEIASVDLLNLAEAEGALILTKGRFTAHITHQHISAWDIAEGEIITLLLEPSALPNIAEHIRSSITQRDDINEWWLNESHLFVVMSGENYVNISNTPVNIHIYIADLALTSNQAYRLAGFLIGEDLQSYILLDGTFTENGDSFIFQARTSGIFSATIIEETEEIEETVEDIFAEPTDPTPTITYHGPPPPRIATMRFVIGEMQYILSPDRTLYSDVAPFVVEVDSETSHVMLPLRVLADGLGKEVVWSESSRSVLIITTIFADTTSIWLDVDVPLPDNMGTPVIVDGRVFVPADYVMSHLGATVTWDEEAMVVWVQQLRQY